MTISGLFLLCSSIHHFFNYYVCHWEDLFTKATGKLFVIYQPQIDDNLLITKIKYDLYQSVLKNISGYTPSKVCEKHETSTTLFWWCSSSSLSYPRFAYRSKLLFFLFFWKWIACCTLSQCMLSKLKMPITTGWYNIFFRREGYIIRIFCSGVTILPLIV